MTPGFPFVDRIQFFSIIFSLFIFFFIFSLVKNKRVREEYSILWFAMSLFLLYLSLDRFAIDRLGTPVRHRLPAQRSDPDDHRLHLPAADPPDRGPHPALRAEQGTDPGDGTLAGSPRRRSVPTSWSSCRPITRRRISAGSSPTWRAIDLPRDILVINDGSADRTSRVARATGQVQVIDLPKNLGIGGAVQTGFKYAARNGYRIAIQFDGDGQHLAAEIPKLLSALQERSANMVIGSRFLDKQAGYRSTFVRRIGIRLFQVVNSLADRAARSPTTPPAFAPTTARRSFSGPPLSGRLPGAGSGHPARQERFSHRRSLYPHARAAGGRVVHCRTDRRSTT